ncbi:phage baseplate protein [Kaistia sp. MMO-174]|uniref:phage baseplate protein n=1 Tax=Kaistia sp. MMO-174 TaxID=3081256 RepID=UPI0030185E01
MRLARELRSVRKDLEDLSRRFATSQMTGRVAAVEGKRVRIEFGQNAEGKKFLSPWLQVQEAAGAKFGGISTHFPIGIGEPMRVFSPTGELGSASIAVRDSYAEDAPRPTDQDSAAVITNGKSSVTLDGDNIVLKGKHILLQGEEIVTDGKTKLNNGTRKVVFEGSKDTDGDTNNEGADGVLV